MMKKSIMLLLTLVLVGCTYGTEKLQTYLDEPKYLIQDRHFDKYKTKRDALESEYLQKKITYAEYIERKKMLDENYAKEVQERDAKMASPDYY
jgi:Tfp pilus assembly protein PilP